ncbi:MAG: hypothetical protein E7138_04570 [Rikenellaceae bacterium]|nr:hypothetical protein [Rikenellaceae bacterium]
MRKLFFIIATCFIFFGCKGEDASPEMPETESWFSPHFITEYIVASKIEVEINKESGELCLKVLGDEYKTWNKKEISQEAMYFTNLYNDNAYYGSVQPGMNRALAYPLDKITICCDKDFDAEHPAGTPLDKIALLYFSTFYPYIEGGYKSLDSYYNDRIRRMMNFAQINADRTKLMWVDFITSHISQNYVGKIEFLTPPEKAGEYTFTLEMTTNGETLKTEFTHTFE